MNSVRLRMRECALNSETLLGHQHVTYTKKRNPVHVNMTHANGGSLVDQ